jgi:hypothetical protein
MRASLTILGFATALLLTGAPPATAEITYPWCVQYGGFDGGGRNCGFSTLEQCRATANGSSDFCERNPMYVPNAESSRPARRSRR